MVYCGVTGFAAGEFSSENKGELFDGDRYLTSGILSMFYGNSSMVGGDFAVLDPPNFGELPMRDLGSENVEFGLSFRAPLFLNRGLVVGISIRFVFSSGMCILISIDVLLDLNRSCLGDPFFKVFVLIL